MTEEYFNSELHCTNCAQVVMVRMHTTDTGNLTITCPNCQHDHYRFVENGIITEDRWRSSGGYVTVSATVWISSTNSASTTTATAATVGGSFLRDSWINSSSASS